MPVAPKTAILAGVILYRPTGLEELRLVAQSGWREWPPRLPSQPIFYPVLTLEYARKIARDWNANDAASGHIGFVTRFEVSDAVQRYETERVGGRAHEELWIPAAKLAAFNSQIVGRIVVVESFPGAAFVGSIDPASHLPRDWSFFP